MAPNQVTKDQETDIWCNLYLPKQRTHQKISKSKDDTKRPRFRFKVDDKVRISHLKHVFSREYDQKWSGEIFKITKCYLRGGLPVYQIRDFHDKDIKGSFYQPKLSWL